MSMFDMLKASLSLDKVEAMMPGYLAALSIVSHSSNIASAACLLQTAAIARIKHAAALGQDIDPAAIRELSEAAGQVAGACDRLRIAAGNGFSMRAEVEAFKEAQGNGAGTVAFKPTQV